MTVDVKLNLKDRHSELPVIFTWMNEQGLKHIVDWRWTKPDVYNNQRNTSYIFQFENEKHAEWFSLRWL